MVLVAPKEIGMANSLTVHRDDRIAIDWSDLELRMANTPIGSVTNLNSYLGIHPAGLKVSAQRNELLARNLANADTPNYKSRDIDFRSALAKAGSVDAPVHMAATNSRHIAVGNVAEGGSPDLKYRVPLAPSLDGNTVDAQLEQSAFAQNAVRYQASLTFLTAKFRELMTSITGQ
jgi:flagellar basal-body rod protein FlgB